MSRITITLSGTRYRALKEAAAQRQQTIGQLIDASLKFYGKRTEDETRALISAARESSNDRSDTRKNSSVSNQPEVTCCDQLFWDLLATRADLVLVTGDKLLLSASNMIGAGEWCAE